MRFEVALFCLLPIAPYLVRETTERSGRARPISPQAPENLNLTRYHQLLNLGDRFRRVEVLWTRLRAVHNRVAAVKTEGILEVIEPFARRLVAAVYQPPIRLQQG